MPKAVRDRLGIKPGSKVRFDIAANGDVVVHRDPPLKAPRESRFARVRGTASVKMTTQEIMALTRGTDD